jgi:hypothetical protein
VLELHPLVLKLFSSFGLVHSKLCNRLGIEKAGKLGFLFKLLNRNPTMTINDNALL